MSPTRSCISRPRARLAALAALALLAACSGAAAPAAERPAPVVTDTSASALEPELSTFAVTFRIPKARLAQVLDSLAPRMQSAKSRWTWADRVGLRYAWARGPVEVGFRGDTIHLGTDVDYQLRLCYRVTNTTCWPPVECGWSDTRFRPPALRARLAMWTRLRLSPSWRLVTETRPLGEGFSADERNRCRFTVARFDATPYLAREVRSAMDSLGREFDRWAARQGNFRREAERLWALAQRPLDLGGGAWLVVDPVAVHAEPVLAGGDGALGTTVAVQARPYVVVGERPELTAPFRPLPPLRTQEVRDSLHVSLPIEARFEALNALLAETFAGDTIESGGRRYVVRAVSAEPVERRVRITADVEGFFDGRLVLTGTPTFDPATNRLTLPDLDYTLSTRNLLAKLGDAFGHGGFRRRLRETTAWELGPSIDTARTRLDGWLNRPLAPGVQARGGIARLRFVGVRVEGDRVRVLLVADGTAAIEMAATGP
jgi:hypothetical protein